jgi:hypothetical protein
MMIVAAQNDVDNRLVTYENEHDGRIGGFMDIREDYIRRRGILILR